MTRLSPEIRAPFVIPAESYDRLMGRYLPVLAPAFADAADVHPGLTALDVGCGPGGLTRELVDRLGAGWVTAIDPSPPFVTACAERNPGADVRQAVAEQLPFADASFDVTLASLVVGFMSDPVAGVREMARVTKPGGIVATCFWDRERMLSLNTFWRSAASIPPGPDADMRRLGTADGELATLLREIGLLDVRASTIPATAEYADFEDWWRPFTLGVGPVGVYYESLTPAERNQLRETAHVLLGEPAGAFTLTAHAWCATGRVG
jgi:ubiquinone/menaquinone biosynthesis C-methylase UbiE